MIRINRKTEYAIFLIHYLQCRKGNVSLKKVSDLTNLSYPLLSKVATLLTEEGILISKEGARGGYCLEKKIEKITLGEVIALFEPQSRIVSCFSGRRNCVADCRLKNFWRQVEEDIRKNLKKVSLSQMLK